jgi:ribosomal protein L2
VKHGFSIHCVSSNDDSAVKMKRMTGTVYNFLECSLKTAQHVTVLMRSVESRVVHRFSRPEEFAEYEV